MVLKQVFKTDKSWLMTSLVVRVMLLLAGAACAGGMDEPDTDRQQRHLISNLIGIGNTEELNDAVKKQLDQSEVLYTTADYTRKHGYPLETHTVTTEDGYLLTVHRIPGSPRAAAASGVKAPVFLQHGVAMASDTWLVSGPDKSLAFILADEGYDVWIGNARGNRYSRKHLTLSSRDLSFYNFTWHEMGVYDLPAVIDYVLDTTNHSKLFYVGHSMGTTMFFVLTSTMPEYNQKIRLMVAMAPAAYVWRLRSTLGVIPPFANYIVKTFMSAQEGQVSLRPIPLTRLLNAFCGDGKPFQEVCIFTYLSSVGFNRKELNTTLLPSMLTHLTSGLTVQLLNHYAQIVNTARFQTFHRSGRTFSRRPEYDLSKISAPVAILYSVGDYIVPPEGVLHLSKRLPNLVKLVRVADDRVNHMDYIYAIHTKELFYNEIVDLISKF